MKIIKSICVYLKFIRIRYMWYIYLYVGKCLVMILCLFRIRVLFLIMFIIVCMIKCWVELFSDWLGFIEIKIMFIIKKFYILF